MKTILFIKTWRCNKCNSAMDFEPTELNLSVHFQGLKDNECSNKFSRGCTGQMVKVIDEKMKSMLTIMGEEDIETEITEVKERKQKGEGRGNDPDVSTLAKENVYRTKRKQDILEAIAKVKLLEDI